MKIGAFHDRSDPFPILVLIPQGDMDVVEKLVRDGEFVIASALFPEPKVQGKVDHLSQRLDPKRPKRAP